MNFTRRASIRAQSSLKIAMCGAEPWTNAMRAEIEEAFDLHAIDNYGLSEMIGPGVSCECIESKDGPHIWEDHFYPEVIDPATGKVLPDGEVGELVFTTLTKEAMPVIRYRTRDLSRLLPGTARIDAPHGKGHRPLRRHDDRARRQRVSRARSRRSCSRTSGWRPISSIELRRAERLDEITVVVEAREAASTTGALAACDRDLAHHIKELIGVTATVRTVKPGTVERSLGKAKRVIDLRSRN